MTSPRRAEGSEWYQEIIEQIIEMVFLTDDQGTITYVSPSSERLFGSPPGSMAGKHFSEFLHGSSVEDAVAAFRKAVAHSSETSNLHLLMQRSNGEIFTGALSARRFSRNGKIGTVGVIRDITDQAQSRTKLQRTEANLRSLIDNADGIIWSVDMELRYIIGNAQFTDLIEAARGRPFEQGECVLAPEFDAVNPTWRGFYERARSGESFYEEMRLHYGAVGQVMLYHFSPIRDEAGDISGVTVFGKDVTVIRTYERDLRSTTALLENVAAHYPDSFVSIIEEDRTVGFTSGQEFAKQDLNPKQFEGLTLEQVFGDHAPTVRDHYDRAFQGEEQSFELCIDGQFQRYRAVPLLEQDGSIQRILAVAQNINEEKRAIIALQQSENRYRSLFENVNEAVAVHDVVRDEDGRVCDLVYVDCNSTYEDLTKLSREDILGKRALEVIPNLEQRWIDAYGEVVESGQPRVIIDHTDYLDKFWEVKAFRSGPEQLAVAFTDISDRVRAEQSLQQSEERYRLMFENAPVGYQSLDEQGCILDVTDVWLEMLGYQRHEVIGKWFGDFLHPDQRPVFRELFPQNIKRRDVIEGVEFKLQRSDGSIVDARFTAQIGLNEDGTFRQTHCVFMDVTDSKAAAERLAQSEERYRLIDGASVDYIYSYDLEGRFTHANRNLCEALQRSADEILGRTHAELGFPQDQCEEWDELHRRVYETEETVRAETSTPMPDGMVRHYEVTLNLLHDAKGQAIGIAGTTHDITDRKLAEIALRESEAALSEAQSRAKLGSWSYSIEQDATTWSREMYRIFDYPIDLDPPSWTKHKKRIHPEDWARIDHALQQAADKGIAYHEQFRILHTTGEMIWAETIGGAIRDGSGCIRRLAGTVQEITEKKLAEIALRAAETQNRALLDYSPVCHKIVDLELNLQYMSRNGFYMLGLDEDADVYGKPYPFSFFPEAFRCAMTEKLRRVVATGERLIIEATACDVEGNDVRLHSTLVPVPDDHGKLDYITVVSADVTAERHAQQALIASEEKFRSIFENKGTATGIFGDDGIITECNDELSTLLGYPRGEIIGKMKWSDVVVAEDLKRLQEYHALRTKKEGAPPSHYECRLTNKQGRPLDVIVNISVLDSMRIVSLTDITERKRAEERYRLLATNTTDVIWTADLKGHFTYVSPSIEQLRGYTPEEAIQQSFEDVLTPESLGVVRKGIQDILRLLEEGGDYPIHEMRELEQPCKDGSTVWTEVMTTTLHGKDGELEGFLGVSRDITERKHSERVRSELEAQLRQSQKLESIGTLASGVAHEINNPLMGMINYADLIHEQTDDERLKSRAQVIMDEGRRIGRIVSNLLSFARQDTQEHSLARMSDIVDRTLSLIAAPMRKAQIEIELDVPEDLPQVRCRSQQIQQVLMNLLTNAQYALNERYDGSHDNKVIRIEAQTVCASGQQWLRTTVEDHGMGIAETDIERVFDPFFTTKPRETGTGLGLAVSYGIAKDHGGRLTVESQPGEWTRFHLDLLIAPRLIDDASSGGSAEGADS